MKTTSGLDIFSFVGDDMEAISRLF
jgi:hypothetical protein